MAVKSFKKHKTIDNEVLGKRLCDEVNRVSDVKTLSLSLHLHIEYYLYELIKLKFYEPKFIIDDNELGSFYNKCRILRALGVFSQKDNVLRNIKLITRIRNFYAHSLIISDKLPDENKNRIKQLIYLGDDGNESDYDYPWDEHEDEYIAQLHVCGVSTIMVLQRMVKSNEISKQ